VLNSTRRLATPFDGTGYLWKPRCPADGGAFRFALTGVLCCGVPSRDDTHRLLTWLPGGLIAIGGIWASVDVSGFLSVVTSPWGIGAVVAAVIAWAIAWRAMRNPGALELPLITPGSDARKGNFNERGTVGKQVYKEGSNDKQ